ncbi:MAG: aminopeptidase [Acidimicrobiia bacterium]|nr:MAG: aminopeptidase [Acidimicrobiia bacterium]
MPTAPTHRLPRTVVPVRYDLTVRPDLPASRFDGEVTIDLDVAEPVRRIVLNAHELTVEPVRLHQDGVDHPVTVEAEPHAERVVVRAGGELAPGRATLTLRFAGRLAHGLVGFYRSTFTGDDGTEHVLAATQFEAPHARRAFPCFDEPDFKAVFSVTLVVDEHDVALSNGPEVARTPAGDGRVAVRFADTIPMSTYLVAFVVGPLECSDPIEVDGVPVRVCHVPGRGRLAGFAREVAAFALRYFRDYYGIPYPGRKLDLVALPDFAFGAMENLGCVTFRESLLLVDERTVTQVEAANVALTIVHEIAHMWFGDLVTMRWWNGIWLNEAFATFMEHAGVDAYRPQWRTWDDFALSRAAAMDIDALANTRAIEYEVRTPEDADGMFDVLTYQKGGSVVRMLEQWLGTEAFRDGVRHYLARYGYANTETTDLWDALEEATGRPARRIMDTWIFQPGFPEVTVERVDGGVRLAQRRFTYEPADSAARWAIPVLVRSHTDAGEHTEAALLDGDTATVPTPPGAVVVVGAGGEGFFRVRYPAAWRDELLARAVLRPRERFAVLDDAWALTLAGDAAAADFLALAERFGAEDDLVVWRLLTSRLRDAARLLHGDALAAYRARVRSLLRPAFDRLGWEAGAGDDPRARQLRGVLLDALGTLGHDDEVVGRAPALLDGGADPDVVAAAVAVAAHHGDAGRFERFLDRFRTAPTPQEQLRYLFALAQFPDESLVLRAVELALGDEVRAQNAPFLVQRALRHADHGRRAWETVVAHWPRVEAKVARTLLPRMFEGVTWLVDDASVADVPAFVAAHPVPEGERVIAQHLERQRVHRALVGREAGRFAAAVTGAG